MTVVPTVPSKAKDEVKAAAVKEAAEKADAAEETEVVAEAPIALA